MNTKNYIKLSKAANLLGITKQTLWNWKHRGNVEFIKIGNLNYLHIDDFNNLMGINEKRDEKVVIYCRVSSSQNKSNLDLQKERLIGYCMAKGYIISNVVTEIGSGLNDTRPKLDTIFRKMDFTKIVVEHKDRLSRHGFNHIQTILNAVGKEVEVVNPSMDDREDLIQDFISIITSYCARIYGKRRTTRQTEKIINELSK
jgi:predicted site-specific integrase-resolvase